MISRCGRICVPIASRASREDLRGDLLPASEHAGVQGLLDRQTKQRLQGAAGRVPRQFTAHAGILMMQWL